MQQSRCAQLYQKYRIESQIGRGASGVCYRVQNIKSKQFYAMKKIHVTSIKKHNTRQACSEVQILSKISHPNIIKLYQFFADEGNVYIVMQYASKGDLHQNLKRRKIRRDFYSEDEVWQMARQLLSALEYLHKRNIIHRDVKTLNIFMDSQSKLYLGDLGVSKILKTDAGLYSRVGTPLYLSPEIIKNQKYDYKADIWGLGCVCYHLAALEHPFQGKNIISLGQNIVAATPKYIQNFSSSLNSFIFDMLQKNPTKRLGASQLLRKYFDKSPITTPISIQVKFQKNDFIKQGPLGIESMNKITGGNKILAGRSNIKGKIFNNFMHQKLSFNEGDIIREEDLRLKSNKDCSQEKGLDQTITLAKKNQMPNQTKKYVEITRKNYLVSKTQNIQIYKHQDKEQLRKYINVKSDKEQKDNMFSIFSEKKVIPPPIDFGSKFSKKTVLPSYLSFERQQNKRSVQSEANKGQMLKLPSEATFSSSKARLRPKSSIMTKQRHENTMRNIRKHYKKEELEDQIQVCFLKRPQVIIL